MISDIFQYVKNKYGVEPDYPLPTAPGCPVLRHEDNRKWFALIMEIPRNRLGLKGEERVYILNVKLADSLMVDILMQQPGYFPAYHMHRGSWISILLDGTVPAEEIYPWIDESYAVTASGKVRQKLRAPKEWLVPANPKYYPIETAFDDQEVIDWKQGRGIRTGDTVLIYAGAPVSAILYRCIVTETDIPYSFQEDHLTITALMKIKLVKRYSPDAFSLERLREEFGVFSIRGPRGLSHSLSEALK